MENVSSLFRNHKITEHAEDIAIIDRILLAANCWHNGITLTHEDEHPLHVNFLDLVIHLDEPVISFETYRKPNCLYMYTPWNSCHHVSVKTGVVATEVIRLLRTNSRENSFRKHISILQSKFKHRGYPVQVVMSQVDLRP